ncbi:hypothetical protein ACVWZR_004026 [Bradyrhizobium sp. i1.3.1]
MGDAPRPVAPARPRGRRGGDPPHRRGRTQAGHRDADTLRLLHRQLATAENRSRRADDAAALLSRQRGAEPRQERRAPHRDRPPRPSARRHRQCDRARGRRHRARQRASLAHCGRLFRARRDPQRRSEGGGIDEPHPRSLLAARYRRSRPSRRRSHHPHLRREAAVGLPALGRRLCRAALHRADVARIPTRAISPRLWRPSTAASAASAASRRSCPTRCRHSPVCDARHGTTSCSFSAA